MKKTINSLAFLLLAVMVSKAQTQGFAYKATIDEIKQSGFYNIAILPPISAHIKIDYSDIRIADASGKWVPHLLRMPAQANSNHTVVTDMPFVNKQVDANAVTSVVKNPGGEIKEILLYMKNTTANRICSISGSFNNSEWFIINDSIVLQEAATSKGDETTCHLRFPPSSYAYFKITINSKKTDPVNITRIATLTAAPTPPGKDTTTTLQENPTATWIQKDSAKVSYIQITQPAAYHFDWLSLQFGDVKFFSRPVEVYVPQTAAHSFANPGRWLQSFMVTNNSTLQFSVPLTKAQVFYLVIHNDDNPPLRITGVSTALQYRVLTAYLEQGNRYQLLLDNANATAPVYDINQLQNKLPKDIPVLGVGNVVAADLSVTSQSTTSKNYNKYLLWGSIALVLIALVYFTMRLTSEVNKRKATEENKPQE